LEIRTERGEVLLERGGRRAGVAVAAAACVMMVMAVMRLAGSLRLLRALLNGGEILLRGAEISGLEILAERLERLENGVGA
jgi:hypothetical protein